MKKNIFLSLLLLTTIHSFSQSPEESKVVLQAKQLNDAIFMNKDSTALEGLLADNVSYGHSTGKIEDRGNMIHGAVSSKQVYTNFVVDSITVFFATSATAILREVLKATSTDNGKETQLHLNILQVWVNQHHQWKLAARQAVKL